MNRSIAALSFVSLLLMSFTDPSAADFLEWNEYRPLTWDDFQGKRMENSAGDAGTVVQIKAKPYTIKNDVYYEVSALFVRSKSWSEAHTPQLLSHEQLHFDLAELYARKIRKEIKALQDAGDHEVKHYNQVVQRLLAESNEQDIEYDLETLHGAMEKKQMEWANRVKHELVQLRSFKKPKQVISAKKG